MDFNTANPAMMEVRPTKAIVPLNHAGASPSVDAVVERIRKHLELEQEVGGYAAAAAVKEEYEAVYHHLAALLDCRADEVAIVDSATTGWTRLFHSFGDYLVKRHRAYLSLDDISTSEGALPRPKQKRRRVIFVSQVEYAANLVAACQWVKQRSALTDNLDDDWTVCMLPSVPGTGKVDVAALQDMLGGQDPSVDPGAIAMVCVTHVPTNSGVANPINDIGRVLRAYNEAHRSSLSSSTSSTTPILYLVDACQSIGQMPVSVRECSCHGLVGTGRKWLRGPRGTGFLYCSARLLHDETGDDTRMDNVLWPNPLDHFGAPVLCVPSSLSLDNTRKVSSIERVLEYSVRSDARRFEFWESSAANRLGLGVAVQHALAQGILNIQASVVELATYLHQQLLTIDGVRTIYPPDCGIVTFRLDRPDEAGAVNECSDRLRDDLFQLGGFEVIVSPPSSTPLDSSITRAPNLVRVSPSYTNSKEELDDFLACLMSFLGEPRGK
jgi:cysteine desulfurase / selenocysteine lyase